MTVSWTIYAALSILSLGIPSVSSRLHSDVQSALVDHAEDESDRKGNATVTVGLGYQAKADHSWSWGREALHQSVSPSGPRPYPGSAALSFI